MGSPSRLAADALVSMYDSFTQLAPWLYPQNADPKTILLLIVVVLSLPTALAVYKQVYAGYDPVQPLSQGSEFASLSSSDLLSRQESRVSQDGSEIASAATSTSDLARSIFGSPRVNDRQILEGNSTDPGEKHNGILPAFNIFGKPNTSREDLATLTHQGVNGIFEETNTITPLASPFVNKQWSPQLNRGLSESTHTDSGIKITTAIIHIYCTHIEQKLTKNGLTSIITRPSFHVPVAQFPQLQTTFSVSSERAFFNSQQELSRSPIVRDPRYLDLQYRVSKSTSPPAAEVNFDEILSMVKNNKKANQDTAIHVNVARVKEIVPCVLLTYTYHGHKDHPVASTTSTYFGEEVSRSTKIIDFKAHLIRVKHLSPSTIFWDCARHITKSVKHDHGMILQTRNVYVEISAQDQSNGGVQQFKMTSPESIKSFIRDTLPELLVKNGNVVPLQVSAYKKT